MKKIKLLIITLAIIFAVLITNIIYKEEPTNNNYQPKPTKSYNNALSIMLETGSNTNEYEASTITSWPTEGYEFNKELSKCENGGELSFNEETKRLELITDKPDKCYAYFDKYLEFYLDDVLFTAKPKMTWEEWINSSFSGSFKTDSHLYTSEELLTIENVGKYGAYNDTDKYIYLYDYTYSGQKIAEYYFIFTYSGNSENILRECYNMVNHLNLQLIKNNKIKDTLKYAELDGSAVNHPNDIGDSKFYSYHCASVCLSPETLIDVEEIDEKGKKRRRRKKLKDIKVGDKVICINPFTLELDTDTVVECDGEMNKRHTCYDNWYFSDGTIITTIHRHRFYNVENNKFMYMEEWNIGEHGLNINNEKIELIKHEHIEEEINHCTLFTEKYNNYFANGLLSGNRRSKNIKL